MVSRFSLMTRPTGIEPKRICHKTKPTRYLCKVVLIVPLNAQILGVESADVEFSIFVTIDTVHIVCTSKNSKPPLRASCRPKHYASTKTSTCISCLKPRHPYNMLLKRVDKHSWTGERSCDNSAQYT